MFLARKAFPLSVGALCLTHTALFENSGLVAAEEAEVKADGEVKNEEEQVDDVDEDDSDDNDPDLAPDAEEEPVEATAGGEGDDGPAPSLEDMLKDDKLDPDMRAKLDELMKSMGDLKNMGPSAPSAQQKMTACANLAARRAGTSNTATIRALEAISTARSSLEVVDSELMQVITVCSENLSDEDYALWSKRKMKKMPDRLMELQANDTAAAAEKIKTLDPLLFDAAQQVAEDLAESASNRQKYQQSRLPAGPELPAWLSWLLFFMFSGGIAILAWLFIDMQTNVKEDKVKMPSQRKMDKRMAKMSK